MPGTLNIVLFHASPTCLSKVFSYSSSPNLFLFCGGAGIRVAARHPDTPHHALIPRTIMVLPPAISSALPRRSFPRFAGAIFRAKPALVSEMRLHPPPHYAGTLRPTTPALSPEWARRSPPRCSRALPRTSPCYASSLPRATPALGFPLPRRSFLRCDGAILSQCWWAISRCDSGILRAATALTFSQRRRSVSCCAGAIVLASPGQSVALPRCGKKDSAGQREE